MGKFPIVLDRFIFEVRFGSGYLYFDRCGQSLLDIMHQRHGWLPLTINPLRLSILKDLYIKSRTY
jgi:hypothetical protein